MHIKPKDLLKRSDKIYLPNANMDEVFKLHGCDNPLEGVDGYTSIDYLMENTNGTAVNGLVKMLISLLRFKPNVRDLIIVEKDNCTLSVFLHLYGEGCTPIYDDWVKVLQGIRIDDTYMDILRFFVFQEGYIDFSKVNTNEINGLNYLDKDSVVYLYRQLPINKIERIRK